MRVHLMIGGNVVGYTLLVVALMGLFPRGKPVWQKTQWYGSDGTLMMN